MMKESISSTDTEFDRTLSNPENLIMSDSLDGLLDPEVLDIPDVWDVGNFTCFLNFKEEVVGGTLRSFSVSTKQRTLTLVATDEAAIQLLKQNYLQSYVCKSVYGDIIDSSTIDAVVDIEVRFNDQRQTALVTVTIPNKEDS